MKLKAYIRYSADGDVVPMSLVKVPNRPLMNGDWYNVLTCCDPNYVNYLSSEKMKAWMQLSKKGEVMSGPILRVKRPSSGSWIQVPATSCCSFQIIPIAITTQPADAFVVEGNTATFTVSYTGNPVAFQWQKDGVDISGATSASYTTPVTVSGDDGSVYTVVLTNSLGTVTSDPATLTLGDAPAITTQPTDEAVVIPATATFTVTATGTATLTYQWKRNNVDISGATSASYTTPATTLGDNASTYKCVVTNDFGTATSQEATLTATEA